MGRHSNPNSKHFQERCDTATVSHALHPALEATYEALVAADGPAADMVSYRQDVPGGRLLFHAPHPTAAKDTKTALDVRATTDNQERLWISTKVDRNTPVWVDLGWASDPAAAVRRAVANAAYARKARARGDWAAAWVALSEAVGP